jgi:UPF0716 protein FxsA
VRIALLLYPLVELWSLIELGAQTSAGLAVLWVLGAGFLGMTTIRFAGAQVLSRLQAAQREGVLQQQLVASDMALAIAGLLLIIPGLFSDALAVLVLLEPFRRLVGFLFAARWSRRGNYGANGHTDHDTPDHAGHGSYQDAPHAGRTHDRGDRQDDGITLEGEFQELDREAPPLPRHGSDPPDSDSL